MNEPQLVALSELSDVVKTVFTVDTQMDNVEVGDPIEFGDRFQSELVITFKLKCGVHRGDLSAICKLVRDRNGKAPLWRLFNVILTHGDQTISVHAKRTAFGVEYVCYAQTQQIYSIEDHMRHFAEAERLWPGPTMQMHAR